MVSEFCPLIFKILEQFSLDRETKKMQVKAFWYMQLVQKTNTKTMAKLAKKQTLKSTDPLLREA